MCSYGGKILPRPHDNQLSYVGGDTKILAVDRNIRFSSLLHKLNSISDTEVCFKYQLPGEDLDALISVTNDEDLEHMMLEYDRLYRGSNKPARLRLFLFPVNATASFGSSVTKSERQWFVDALNSVQIQNSEDSSPPAAAASAVENPDFLFGFDKGGQVPAAKMQDPAPVPTFSEVFTKEVTGGSDCGSEDRHVIGDPVVMQRHMQELQMMQIADQEQARRRNEEINQARAYYGDYYTQKVPPPQPAVPMAVQQPYWHEPQMTTGGGYGAPASVTTEPPVYLISTGGGVYQAPAMRPVSGQVAQPYYGMQRPVYNTMGAPPSIQQQQNIGGYTEGIGMMRPPGAGRVGISEQGYAHVSYDGAGRQVYYTTTAGGVVPPYQVVGEMRQGGSPMHPEGGG